MSDNTKTQLKDAREIRKHFSQSIMSKNMSAIRGVAKIIRTCKKELAAADLKTDAENTLDLTMGDIDPLTFSKDGKEDLANVMGLDPTGRVRKLIEEFVSEERITLWENNIAFSRYELEARGYEPLRREYKKFLENYGAKYSVEDIILTHSGVESLYKTLLAAENIASRKKLKVNLIFPYPGFTPIIGQAELLHIPVQYVQTFGKNKYCVTPEMLKKVLINKTEDISVFYATPVNNPTSTVYEKETFAQTLHEFLKYRPNGIILADLTYLEMAEEKSAQEIINCLKDKNVFNHVVISMSMSKMFGYPRLRSGALYISDPKLYETFFKINQTINASLSGPMELEAYALWKIIDKKTRNKMYDLLRQRQNNLLKKIRVIDDQRNSKNFKPLVDKNNISSEVPLYIYLKLAPHTNFMDFFIETGLGGIPGSAFGDKESENMVRFSVGTEAINL